MAVHADTEVSLQDALAKVPTVIEEKKTETIVSASTAADDGDADADARSDGGRSIHIGIGMRLVAVLLVSLIGFGSHWSSGVTSAMKSTLKKVSQDRERKCMTTDVNGCARNSTSTTPNTRFSKPRKISWSRPSSF